MDDEFIMRQGIRFMMKWQDAGYEIVGEASNGKEALELIRSRRVDMNKILTKVVSIEEAPETIIDIETNPGDYMKVVVRIADDPNPEK